MESSKPPVKSTKPRNSSKASCLFEIVSELAGTQRINFLGGPQAGSEAGNNPVRLSWHVPFILHRPAFSSDLDSVQKDLASFALKCQKMKVQRAQEKLKDAAAEVAVTLTVATLAEVCGEEEVLVEPSVAETFKAAFSPQIVHVSGHTSSSGQEKFLLPTLRMNWSGTRTVVMVSFSSLVKHLTAQPGGVPKSLEGLWSYLHSAKPEDLKKMAASIPVYHATIGPEDILWTPYGYVLSEATLESVSGLKVPCLPKTSCMRDEIKEVVKFMKSNGIQSNVQEACLTFKQCCTCRACEP